jgi:hypothetical protein
MNPLKWVVKSASERGVLQTTKIAGNLALDVLFDWKYGTDTLRWVETAAIESAPDGPSYDVPDRSTWRATKAKPLLRLLGDLVLPREQVFVVFGWG